MSTNDAESLLRYYTSELSYLRRMGGAFAKRYPRVASRLELSADVAADPHVERLIESFAYLTARLQRRIDNDFPDISAALLGVIYPHLVNPVPSMAIARFDVDPEASLSEGQEIQTGTQLFTQTAEGLTCRYRTCYPVTLWPLKVEQAQFELPTRYEFLDNAADVASVLRLRLTCLGQANIEDLQVRKLRFYLHGDATVVNSIYELIFCNTLRVALLPEDGGKPFLLPLDVVKPVGYEPDEQVIPYPSHALPAYRLIQEYFLFPQKYQFFDVEGLDAGLAGKRFDLLLLLDRRPPDRIAIDDKTFALGCTPIINRFQWTTEPIRIDHRQQEYLLESDYRRPRTYEIHSIESVSASPNPLDESQVLSPFYAFRHRPQGGQQRAFWYSRRVPSIRENMPGTDVLMSFVDMDFNPRSPDESVMYAHVWCTNRDFTDQLSAGEHFQVEGAGPLQGITCMGKPTSPVYPPLGGRTLWHLVSNLSLNYLSLSNDTSSRDALQEVLRIYAFSDAPSAQQQVQGVIGMECRRATRRLGREAWRGFCQGTVVTLTFDESLYVGSGAFLLGMVLNRFLPLHASINSFTQLVIRSKQREEDWKSWPPRAGLQELL